MKTMMTQTRFRLFCAVHKLLNILVIGLFLLVTLVPVVFDVLSSHGLTVDFLFKLGLYTWVRAVGFVLIWLVASVQLKRLFLRN